MGPSHGSTELIVSSPSPKFEVNLARTVSLTRHTQGNLVHHSPILPSDIIAQVCKELFDSAPGPDQYDLSLTRVSPDRWGAEQRFWSGLALVSRIWWEPATKVLYEHVVLRHVTQIAALARTLRVRAEDIGVDFGALVQRVTFHECVVFFPEYSIIDEDIRTIFERCMALKELTLRCRPDGVDVDVVSNINSNDRLRRPETRINPMWIFPQIIAPTLQARGATTLRKLDLLALKCGDQNALYNLISASPHLTSLAVQNLEAPGPDLPTLQFLEELVLDSPSDPPPPSSREIWQWSLPRLRSLTILQCLDIPIPVLQSLGRTLTYLHIYAETSCAGPHPPSNSSGSSSVPTLCPVLEHLVLHPHEFLFNWHPALFHESIGTAGHFPRLRFLDVWVTSQLDGELWNAECAAAVLAHARASFAPALEGVRAMLEYSRGLRLPYALPTICHPSAMRTPPGAGEGEGGDEDRSDESRLVCVRDVWVLQTAWCVRSLAECWLDEDMWLEDDSSDYVYESPSEDSAEGSEWGSDSGSELSEGSVIGP